MSFELLISSSGSGKPTCQIRWKQSSPEGENFRILILDIEIYQISRAENKSVSSKYVVYVLCLFFSVFVVF